VELLICDARTVSLVTLAAYAPIPGERLTRHDIQDLDNPELIAAFEYGAWDVVEVVPIEDWPGRVKVYAQPAERVESTWGGAGILPF